MICLLTGYQEAKLERSFKDPYVLNGIKMCFVTRPIKEVSSKRSNLKKNEMNVSVRNRLLSFHCIISIERTTFCQSYVVIDPEIDQSFLPRKRRGASKQSGSRQGGKQQRRQRGKPEGEYEGR